MKKYRKKPIVVEAMQWEDNTECAVRLGEFCGTGNLIFDCPLRAGDPTPLFIETLEGRMSVNVGDYIIKGLEGEFYPCKQSIFEATYEEFNE